MLELVYVILFIYNPLTCLSVVPERAALHLYNQVLHYIVTSILMLEFPCVILFIKSLEVAEGWTMYPVRYR
jgi:hypothetical protein